VSVSHVEREGQRRAYQREQNATTRHEACDRKARRQAEGEGAVTETEGESEVRFGGSELLGTEALGVRESRDGQA
jgi:hypothetical protein